MREDAGVHGVRMGDGPEVASVGDFRALHLGQGAAQQGGHAAYGQPGFCTCQRKVVMSPFDQIQMSRLMFRFALELLKRRVRVLERGAWFMSAEHGDGEIDDTLEAVRAAAVATAAAVA